MSAATDIITKPHSDSEVVCGSSPTDHVFVDRNQFNPELDKVIQKLTGEEHVLCQSTFGQSNQGFEHDDGRIFLTNFRCYSLRSSRYVTVNIPLGLIESAEYRDLTTVLISCKDGRVFKFNFTNNSLVAQELVKAITEATEIPSEIDKTFAAKYMQASAENSSFKKHLSNGFKTIPSLPDGRNCSDNQYETYEKQLADEMKRMGFSENLWQIVEVNKDFKTCPTYPQVHIFPVNVTDSLSSSPSTGGSSLSVVQKLVESAASFRAEGRFPSVVWRHPTTGAVLIRSSQPQSGLFNRRSNADEDLLKSIARAALPNNGTPYSNGTNGNSTNGDMQGTPVKVSAEGKLLVIDARSYKAALGNWMKGGGVESQENYGSELIYMNIENIHQVRKSLQSLRSLYATSKVTGDVGFWSSLDSTQWLTHLSTLLSSAYRVSRELCAGRSVLVHCSDGWDRTPQIVSLAELILDPYYRTLKGFQVLVDREWLCFGHKFADRCGNPPNAHDPTERSPIFLQWLDCVYQLMCQYPTAFEFTETFLLKLLLHAYSNLYGTFMCNSLQERCSHHVWSKTRSVWPALFQVEQCKNVLFDKHRFRTLRVSYSISHLQPWRRAYVTREYNVGSAPSNTNGNADRESPNSTPYQNGNMSNGNTPAIAIPKQSSPVSQQIHKTDAAHSFEGKSPILSTNLSGSTDSVLIVAPPPQSSPSPQPIGSSNGVANMSGGDTVSPSAAKEAGFSMTQVDRTEDDQLFESDEEFQLGDDTLPTYVDPVQEAAREYFISLNLRLATANNSNNCFSNENGFFPAPHRLSASGRGNSGQMRLSGSSPDVTGCDYVQPDVRAEVPASWLPDSLFPYCSACKKEFGYLRGRHHCRSCGHVFCDGCSNLRAVVPAVASGHVRVCQSCYRKLNSTAPTAKSMYASIPSYASSSTPTTQTTDFTTNN